MKLLVLISGGLLVLLNAAVLLMPEAGLPAGAVPGLSLLFGVVIVIAAALQRSEPAPTPVVSAPLPPAPAPAPPPAAPRAEAELVALLALLQEKGRLIDFVNEEIAPASDEQVGAAARVVHEGCRKVIREYFEIAPLRTETEGSPIQLTQGYDTAAHRLIGSVPDQPPYRGQLVHPGWEARAVKLPRLEPTTESRRWPVIAPAEIEIA